MFIYLFLLAAAIAAPEIPTTQSLPLDESQEIQELIAILAQEEQEKPQEQTSAVLRQAQDERTVEVIAVPITITNAIEPKMLEYKHWTGKYSPEQFAISVNGTEIEQGKTCEVSADTSTIEIAYNYSFMNGIKTGGKKISYQLNENITQANITFDWKDDWRIILDNGKAKEIIS